MPLRFDDFSRSFGLMKQYFFTPEFEQFSDRHVLETTLLMKVLGELRSPRMRPLENQTVIRLDESVGLEDFGRCVVDVEVSETAESDERVFGIARVHEIVDRRFLLFGQLGEPRRRINPTEMRRSMRDFRHVTRPYVQE